MTPNNPPSHNGALLKQAREAKKLSLVAVHEATKIPMDALRAIEEGYMVRSLSTFYYTGFVKMYAKYLGVDESLVLGESVSRAHKEIRETDGGQDKELILNFDFLKNVSHSFTPQRAKQFVAIFGILLAIFVLLKVVGGVKAFIVHRTKRPDMARTETVRPRLVEVKRTDDQTKMRTSRRMDQREQKTPSAAPAPTKTETSTTASAAGVASAKKVTLTVRARRNTWLQVRADGMVVFQSSLARGAAETWSAKEKIEISGKNVNDLDFELNGKLIGPLGKSDHLARKLIVTQDGLTVKK